MSEKYFSNRIFWYFLLLRRHSFTSSSSATFWLKVLLLQFYMATPALNTFSLFVLNILKTIVIAMPLVNLSIFFDMVIWGSLNVLLFCWNEYENMRCYICFALRKFSLLLFHCWKVTKNLGCKGLAKNRLKALFHPQQEPPVRFALVVLLRWLACCSVSPFSSNSQFTIHNSPFASCF